MRARATTAQDRARHGDRGRTRETEQLPARPASRHSHETFVRAGAASCSVGARGRGAVRRPFASRRTLDTAHFSVHFAEPYRSRRSRGGGRRIGLSAITGCSSGSRVAHADRRLDSLDSSTGTPRRSRSTLSVSPVSADEGELLQNREWLELVLTHEFTHIVHLDQAGVRRACCGRSSPLSRTPLPFTALFPGGFPNLRANW